MKDVENSYLFWKIYNFIECLVEVIYYIRLQVRGNSNILVTTVTTDTNVTTITTISTVTTVSTLTTIT